MDFLCRHRYGKTVTTVWTLSLHRPDAILDKERRGEELQPFGCQGNTFRKHPYSGKIFSTFWKAGRTVVHPNGLSLRPDTA
jgi:hypothetical protein